MFMLLVFVGEARPEKLPSQWNFIDGFNIPISEFSAIEKLRLACPYHSDRRERGLLIDEAMPPVQFVLSAHSPNLLIENMQSRRSAGINVPLKAVPCGLTPEVHYVCSPLEREPELPDDLDFAVRTVIAEAGNIDNWR